MLRSCLHVYTSFLCVSISEAKAVHCNRKKRHRKARLQYHHNPCLPQPLQNSLWVWCHMCQQSPLCGQYMSQVNEITEIKKRKTCHTKLKLELLFSISAGFTEDLVCLLPEPLPAVCLDLKVSVSVYGDMWV